MSRQSDRAVEHYRLGLLRGIHAGAVAPLPHPVPHAQPLPHQATVALKRHRSELAGHQFLIEDFSTGRPFNFVERLAFAAAARDPVCADLFAAFGSRSIGVGRFLRPDALARAIRVNARHALGAMQMHPLPMMRHATTCWCSFRFFSLSRY